MDKDNLRPPTPTHGDNTHTAVKVVLSAIPVLGGSAAELFDHVMTSPLARRREEWMKLVCDRLNNLDNIDYATLVNNEEFVSAMIEATIAAIKTANNNKRNLLKNAIAKGAQDIFPKNDWSIVFIRYVDELTYEHVLLLSAMCETPENLTHVKSYGDLFNGYSHCLGGKVEQDYFKYLCSDLSNKGLIRVSADINDFGDVYEASSLLIEDTDDSLPRVKITEMGAAFIDWVVD